MCTSFFQHAHLTKYPESVDRAVQSEEDPEDLRGVHTHQPAPPHSVHAVVHLSAGQQAEAEHVSRARHGKVPVHHPILFTVQQNLGVRRQVPGVQTGRVTGR